MCRPAVGWTRASSRGPAGRHGLGHCSCASRTRRHRWYEVRFRLLRDHFRVGALGAPDEVDIHQRAEPDDLREPPGDRLLGGPGGSASSPRLRAVTSTTSSATTRVQGQKGRGSPTSLFHRGAA